MGKRARRVKKKISDFADTLLDIVGDFIFRRLLGYD